MNSKRLPETIFVDVYVNGTLQQRAPLFDLTLQRGQQTEPRLPLSVMKAAQIKSLPRIDAATERRPLIGVGTPRWLAI